MDFFNSQKKKNEKYNQTVSLLVHSRPLRRESLIFYPQKYIVQWIHRSYTNKGLKHNIIIQSIPKIHATWQIKHSCLNENLFVFCIVNLLY